VNFIKKLDFLKKSTIFFINFGEIFFIKKLTNYYIGFVLFSELNYIIV